MMFHRIVLTVGVLVILLTITSCSAPETAPPADTQEVGEVEITEATEAATTDAAEVEAREVREIETVEAVAKEPASDALEVIISLGDEKLTMEQIKWVHPSATDSQIASLAKWWLENELLCAEAEKRGIADEPRAKFLARLMRKNVLQKELVTRLQDTVKVTDEDALAHYEKIKETDPRLMQRGYLGFSHVRTKTLEEAKAVLQRIKAGEKIEELAKEFRGSDRRKGGTERRIMYEAAKKRFGTKLFEAITAAKIDELIGPIEVETGGGYEVARKESETKPRPRPFEEVRDRIKSRLERTQKQKVVKDLLDSLKEKAAERIVKSPRLIEAEKSGAEQPTTQQLSR